MPDKKPQTATAELTAPTGIGSGALLGCDPLSLLMTDILLAKAKRRRELAALPIEEKLVIMERLRDFAVGMKKWREEIERNKSKQPNDLSQATASGAKARKANEPSN